MPKSQPPAARVPGGHRAAGPDLSLLTTPAFSRYCIPFRRADLLAMCLKDSPLPSEQQAQVALVADLLAEFYHREFHRTLTRLQDSYAPFDPDRQVKVPVGVGQGADARMFLRQLTHLLERSHFERLSHRELCSALGNSSRRKLRLTVDLDQFAEVLLFYRGVSRAPESPARNPWQADGQTALVYERVMVCLRFKDADPLQSGRILLKLFRDVPQTELEMLFPNAVAGARGIDRLALGATLALGGGWLSINAAGFNQGASAGLMNGLWPQWAAPAGPMLETAAGLAVVLALLAWQARRLGARKLGFARRLAGALQHQVSDNNAGVFRHLLAAAEEEEGKEALLAYHGLLLASEPVTAAALDQQLRHWFAYKWHSQVVFDVEDALQKLLRLGLVRRRGHYWLPKPAAEALHILRAQIYADLG